MPQVISKFSRYQYQMISCSPTHFGTLFLAALLRLLLLAASVSIIVTCVLLNIVHIHIHTTMNKLFVMMKTLLEVYIASVRFVSQKRRHLEFVKHWEKKSWKKKDQERENESFHWYLVELDITLILDSGALTTNGRHQCHQTNSIRSG